MLTARMNRLFPELSMFPPMGRPLGQVMESLLASPAGLEGPGAAVQPLFPALNVWEDEGAVHVEAELPGWTMDQLEIGMAGSELSIAGRREDTGRDDAQPDGGTYHLRERRGGSAAFRRTLEFRTPIDADGVTATLKDGVLTVTLPKAAEAKPRKIEIRTA